MIKQFVHAHVTGFNEITYDFNHIKIHEFNKNSLNAWFLLRDL